MSMILTLDTNGVPRRWATYQDALCYHARNLISWSAGEIEFEFRGGISRETGIQTVVTISSIIAVNCKHTKLPKYKSPLLTNKNLFRRDMCICAYCGCTFTESKLTRDHIIPVSKGGGDTWMNCVTACWKCNNKKDDHLLSEIDMELLYVPYVPSRLEHLILQNRTILYDQMDFLQACLPANSRVLKQLK